MLIVLLVVLGFGATEIQARYVPLDPRDICSGIGQNVKDQTFTDLMKTPGPSSGTTITMFQEMAELAGSRAEQACRMGFYINTFGDCDEHSMTDVGSIDLSLLSSLSFKVTNSTSSPVQVSLLVVNGLLQEDQTVTRKAQSGSVMVNNTTVTEITENQDATKAPIWLLPGDNVITLSGLGDGVLFVMVMDSLM